MIQSRCGDSTVDEVSHFVPENGQGPLDSVVNGSQKSGTELNGKRPTGVGNRLSGFDTGCILVNLDDGVVADDLDDLSHQLLIPDVNDIVHLRGDTDGCHHRSCDPVNYTFSAHLCILCFV